MARNMNPYCTVCGGSGAGFEFPLWPKCKDKPFGTICGECDVERYWNVMVPEGVS